MKFPGKRSKEAKQAEATGRQRVVKNDGARPQAFSYYAQRSGSSVNTGRGKAENNVDEAKAKRRPLRIHVGIVFAAFLLLAGLVWVLSLSVSPRIVLKTSGGSGYFAQDTQVYEAAAARSLQASLLNRNKLTVDTAALAKDIKNNYPEVAAVTTKLPVFGQNPTVVIEPYKPSFILTTTDKAAFLVDENGRALVSTSQIGSNANLSVPTIEDKSAFRVRLGSQVVSSDTVRFISDVLAVLNASGVSFGPLSLPAAASEFDVSITGAPYFVKFNLQGDARLQAGTFIAAKLRLEKDKVIPAQYIDVRVPERAYYK